MPLNTWPTPSRDTAEFPDVKITIAPQFRQHLKAFLQLDGVSLNDYERQGAELSVSEQRLRTYRKMYERLGVLYHDAQKIKLSSLGIKLKNLETQIESARWRAMGDLKRSVVGTLSRYQLKNPAEGEELPQDCDVLPCICVWSLMRQLENKIHTEEMNRVVFRIMKMKDIPDAVGKILAARAALPSYRVTETELSSALGEQVVTNQPPARISAWFSLLGWGGLIITEADPEGFHHLVQDAIPLVDSILNNPPIYKSFDNESDWFKYYADGLHAANPSSLRELANDFAQALNDAGFTFGTRHLEFVRSFLISIATKPFVILTGLSGSGKTQIALQFGHYLGKERSLLVPVRPDWTGAEALFGYEDALLPSRGNRRAWFVPEVLAFMLKAARDDQNAYLLILDEMNLAHVERYFADLLSGMESLEFCLPNLFPDEDGLWRLTGESSKIAIPRNLFIVGTVNVDETTYVFSPKVLDRANTIEFKVSTDDLSFIRSRPKSCRAGDRALIDQFLIIAIGDEPPQIMTTEDQNSFLLHIKTLHQLLGQGNLEFGHRVNFEILRFANLLLYAGETDWRTALDIQMLQKILPRFHGSRQRLESTMCALGIFAFDLSFVPRQKPEEYKMRFDGLDVVSVSPMLPRSFDKIQRMTRNLRVNQFTSFSE